MLYNIMLNLVVTFRLSSIFFIHFLYFDEVTLFTIQLIPMYYTSTMNELNVWAFQFTEAHGEECEQQNHTYLSAHGSISLLCTYFVWHSLFVSKKKQHITTSIVLRSKSTPKRHCKKNFKHFRKYTVILVMYCLEILRIIKMNWCDVHIMFFFLCFVTVLE